MRTSLNNITAIEEYLSNKLTPNDKFLFEARLILYPALRMDVYFQKKAHLLVKMYHRQKVKKELEKVHNQIFSNPENVVFQQNIYHLFKHNKL